MKRMLMMNDDGLRFRVQGFGSRVSTPEWWKGLIVFKPPVGAVFYLVTEMIDL